MADGCLRRSRLQSGSAQAYHLTMKVQLSHPDRQVEVKGPKRARELLRDLNLIPEAHLVIRGDDLVTEDEILRDGDAVEVRPVISGGSRPVMRDR
jgi:sulfur carrier protein